MNTISKIQNYLTNHKMVVTTSIWVLLWGITIVISTSIIQAHQHNYSVKLEKLEIQNNELRVNVESDRKELENASKTIEDLNEQVIMLTNALSESNSEIEHLTAENEKLKSNTVVVKQTKLQGGTYPEATYVHNYLRELGLNDYVVAGILGNIMAEVGGQTLDFSEWQKWSKSTYYGICQWSAGRRARLLNDFGSSLEAQCKFLGVELFEVIPQGSAFYSMTDEKEAALYFAKVYERCNSKYYAVRQSNATKALNYFAG